MWTTYKVTWLFLQKLCGSVPGSPDLVEAWLQARQPKVRPPSSKSISEIQEEVFETLAEMEPEAPPTILTFQRDGGRLVMRASTVKAHIKDCARVLSAQYVGKIKGERAFSTRVINGVYPDESQYYIPILRPDGASVYDADGRWDKPIHARGPRGEPMNALKTFEYVSPARLDFQLKILGKSVSESDLTHLFNYGGTHGYAGERGDGEGKYTFSLERIDAE